MKSLVYTKEIIVLPEHLDAIQHVNNVVYLQWVNEIAKEHWFSKSNETFDSQYFWVVLNHFIEYKRQAYLGDVIRLSTYVEKNEGVKSTRVVEFFKNDKLLVKTTSTWCLLDKEKNRPCRIPDEVDEMFFSNEG